MQTPKNKLYEALVQCYRDLFVPIRLHFFQDVTAQMKPFLVGFQNDAPMIPFQGEAIKSVLHSMIMFVKEDVLDLATTGHSLLKLHATKSNNIMPAELLKFPTTSRHLLGHGEFP